MAADTTASRPAGFLLPPANEKGRSLRPGLSQNQSQKRLVDRLVDQLVLADPGHHAAQLGTDFFDLVAVVHAADALEARAASLVFLHPVGGELAGLDVVQ